jgi:predicted transcriptional regulator
MQKSRTQQAIDLLEANPEMSQYKVSKLVGLSQSGLCRAVRVKKAKDLQRAAFEAGGHRESN